MKWNFSPSLTIFISLVLSFDMLLSFSPKESTMKASMVFSKDVEHSITTGSTGFLPCLPCYNQCVEDKKMEFIDSTLQPTLKASSGQRRKHLYTRFYLQTKDFNMNKIYAISPIHSLALLECSEILVAKTDETLMN